MTRALWIAITTTATFGIFLLNFEQPARAVWFVTISGLASWAAAVDISEHRLPNTIVGTQTVVIVAGMVTSALASQTSVQSLYAPFLAGLALSAMFLILNILGLFGMGDVKFVFSMAALLTWLGPLSTQMACYVIGISTFVASAIVILRARTLRTVIPYGPFLALGLISGIVVSPLGS